MEKSDYPREFSYPHIITMYMWENYLMTKTKIKSFVANFSGREPKVY